VADPTGGALPGFFRELKGLERDATVLAGKLRAAEAAVSEAAGRDPSEQVRVVLAALGRIASVEVEPRWRSRVDPGDLPAAVLMAYQEAGHRRLETWAAEISRPDETFQPAAGSASLPHTGNGGRSAMGLGSGPSDESSRESMRRLWYLLQDATDQLDDVVRDATARGQAMVTGRDPGRHVTASLTGAGELLDLALEEAWVVEAGGREIGTAMTAAIIDGYALVDQRARESTSQWPFPDLDRLSGSPAALLATLGLPRADTDDDRRQG
jgi:DNA-binding protein YbaB